tara:strand:+ start:2109 stop:2285 length:177 start_codon:yes stop_codon:yes gene_type:complete
MNIKSAKYMKVPKGERVDTIEVVTDTETMYVPMSEDNMHYVEVKKQVDAGTLTIKDAE